MKKAIFSLSLMAGLAIMAACGGGEPKADNNSGTAAPAAAADDVTQNPDYKKGLALVAQSDCLTCHKVNEASTGPSYADVAAKYAGANDETIEKLANTIINGGSGNWGAVPMTAHADLSLDDAKAMVKYVLLLKK